MKELFLLKPVFLGASITGVAFALGFILSCGSEKSFNNPLDPEAQNYTGTKTEASKDGAQPGGTTNCLTDCNPITGTTFTFSAAIDISPSGCTVGSVRTFDTGTELVAFTSANCGARYQVYAQKFSYTGVANGSAVQLSDCSSGTDGVVEFSASRGTSSSLISFTCKNSNSSFVTKVVPLSEATMTAGTVSTYDTQPSAPGAGFTALNWNSSAGVFGYARPTLFQRFGSDGSQIGGAVTLHHDSSGFLTQESGGKWYIVSKGYYWNSACSTVSDSGILQYNATISLNQSYRYLRPFFASGRLLGSGYVYSTQKALLLTLDQSTCLLNDDTEIPFPNETIDISKELNLVLLGDANSGFLWISTSNRLAFGVFSTNQFFSETIIVNGNSTLGNSDIKVVSGKIYIFYSLDGKSYFVNSNESI